MKEEPRRLSDRISDPAFPGDLATIPTSKLRELRGECEEIEAEISFTRRLLHGKLDIVRHELTRRAAGGDRDIETLVERLPAILGDGSPGARGRHMRLLIPRNADSQRRLVDRIASEATLAHIDDLSVQQLSEIMTRLAQAESETSEERKKVQGAIDRLRGELVRRYQEGSEDLARLLGSNPSR